MVHTSASALWFGVTIVGSLLLVGIALRARSYWDEPGAETFSGLAVAAAILGAYLPVLLVLGYFPVTGEPGNYIRGPGGVLNWPTYAYSVFFPLLWAIFAARRKGIKFFNRRRGALLGAMLGGVLVALQSLAWLEGPLESTLPTGIVGAVLPFVTFLLTTAVLISMFGLLSFGIAIILYVAYDNEHVGYTPRVALAAGAVVGWLLPWSYRLVEFPLGTTTILQHMGVATVLTAGLFGLAVTRYNVFEQSVAAGSIGRDEVVETMEDAVVVVNEAGEVLDLNPVAERLFEVDLGDVAGEDVEGVVGEPLPELRTSDLLSLTTLVGAREFEPRASVVSDGEGEVLGFSVVLRDVTERRHREQRLAVLNRVLRHNLRNDLSVISGYAEMLKGTGDIAEDTVADEIADAAYELAEIGEKARTIQRMMDEPPTGPSELAVADAVERALGPVQDEYPECHISVSVDDDLSLAANSRVLVPVLENVLENAAEHNDRPDPHIEVQAAEAADPSTVTITVVDDGPGIPREERSVLESGEVSPLEHGSGLGLWIAKWGVTRLGGELSFAATEPRGTIVTLRLPVEGPGSDEWAPEETETAERRLEA